MCLGNKLSNKGIDCLLNKYTNEPIESEDGDERNSCMMLDIEHAGTVNENFTCDGNLNILHLNIHSLRAKRDLLIDLLESLNDLHINTHVICLCETYTSDLNVKEMRNTRLHITPLPQI